MDRQRRTLELLAPARDLACGMAAIDHGADAVYVGAPRFGARAAAGNSVDDIRQLCSYAHQYGAKVYVTVNTIVYDHELEATRELLGQLSDAGADAVLVQDMGVADLLRASFGRMALHASTQTDNRTAEKVAWLHSIGCSRVVLARELSLSEVADIHHQVPDVELEVFVHGALCVSFSGQCYASQHCFGRSANRGECAQFCRMRFDLLDSQGHLIERGRHLLSLKDLCHIDQLEKLAEAGATSFKIEGRLKDMAYVKNVTAAYSQRLDEIVAAHPDRYCRASDGRCSYTFQPNLQKTFNRGFTHYFLNGRQPDVFSPDTPKAVGEYVGRVKEVRGTAFTVAGTAVFANGDGLCFLSRDRRLEGFRVNRVENNRLFPQKMPSGLRPGLALYRNNDMAFERLMAGKTAVRKVDVVVRLSATEGGFALSLLSVQGQLLGAAEVAALHQKAEKPQRENMERQLSKLGNTPLACCRVELTPEAEACFVPSAVLSALRRQAVDDFLRRKEATPEVSPMPAGSTEKGVPQPDTYREHPYLYNVSNQWARRFYEEHGLTSVSPAFELEAPRRGQTLLMQCRHCLKYSLGHCLRHGGKPAPWPEPWRLRLGDGRLFRLQFDCRRCQMNVLAGG